METITLNEALVSLLVEQDGVDATNAIALLRQAQANVISCAGGEQDALHTQRTVDEVDDIVTVITCNGRFDLFRDEL